MITGRRGIIKKISSILFVGGGTLGHILPIIPVAKMLIDNDSAINIYFIGTKKGLEKALIETEKLFKKTFYLDAQGFKRKVSFYNTVSIYKYIKTYFKSRKILKELKPDIVVGMGGYIAAPVVKAAIRLKIKTVIHEQNSIYGLANRFLKKHVNKVLLSYDIERNEKTHLVGNPRVSEIYYAYKDKIKDMNVMSVLAVGGSRGSDKINEMIISLKERFQEHDIIVTLITGMKYYKENEEMMNFLIDDDFIIKDFVNDLPALMINSGVVIARAGATTIAEIMALKKVCIFIPSPNVTGNHQEKNALAIADKGGAIMLREAGLNSEELFSTIIKLFKDRALRSRIINNLNFITEVDACEKFVRQLNGMVKNE